MVTFGYTGSPGGSALEIGPTRVWLYKATLSEDAICSKATVYAHEKNPDPYVKALIYADSDGVPGALIHTTLGYMIGVSGWYDIPFTPALALDAGDYWIGLVASAAGAYFKVETGVAGSLKGRTNVVNGYVNPPNPFGTPTKSYAYTFNIYITYEPAAQGYPTSMLKKGFISAYHCFMSAYIRAKVEGFDPLKLPDGTVF